MSVHLSDDDIVRSISAHSPEGIEALYDRYGGLAYSVALRILSDRGAAEDVVQESFLSVWRRGSTFQSGRGSLRSQTNSNHPWAPPDGPLRRLLRRA